MQVFPFRHITCIHVTVVTGTQCLNYLIINCVAPSVYKVSMCESWHMRLKPKKTKFMVVSRSQTSAPGYGDLSLGGAELENVKILRILRVPFDPQFTFEAHLGEIVLKAAGNLGIVRRAGKFWLSMCT